MSDPIVIHGARQNNLKNLTIELPANELIVVTGVSGSGKSSLVFDTLYAEGQRRYVETFSPYARQFLDRMDKPQVDRIDGIPPAIAIDQTNPVRTSRSTVGTMTELSDHLKLLFARAASLYCRGCGRAVRRDTPDAILTDLGERSAAAGDPRLVMTFPVSVPANFSETEVRQLLEQQGYTRIHARDGHRLHVVQDRFRMSSVERARVAEGIEAALRVGGGRMDVRVMEDGDALATPDPSPLPAGGERVPEGRVSGESAIWRFSSDLHCPDCDIHYEEPTPSLFSFNSPLGACETCRGFGRVIGIDYGLIVPDAAKSLRDGAVKPWQSPSYRECQDDLEKYARKRGVPLDVPWRELSEQHRRWVLDGEPEWVSWRKSWPGVWYGVARFFAWLETKAYKMHIRVLLSRYRAYTPCHVCEGARLKPDALLWRLGSRADAERVLDPARRCRPCGTRFGDEVLARLPGLTLHDLALLPIASVREFFAHLTLPAPLDEAAELLLAEIRARLGYLAEVGLSYLTLDRQSRTLSGGEVQRINLTTALGTSLVNTLFVLDEPSIGLHPRDIGRVVGVMQRLRDAGNSLVVVEHDPHVMLAADRILDIGPGPGERGGEIMYFGTPGELRHARNSLTADYLTGRRRTRQAPPHPPFGHPLPASGERRDNRCLELRGVTEHNLRNIDVAFPLHALVCVTGVSGSGKSTLVQDVLHPALLRAKGRSTEAPGAYRSLIGDALIDDVVMIDQTPIGRTTRSNPASYVGAFDCIRKRFAAAPLAKERGYTQGTFSFNAGNGRCPACGGNGFEHVEMQFLSDVYLRCPDCDGKRFRREVLEVTLQGRSIADVLDMTVAQAQSFFAGERDIETALRPLVAVGLDYLKLGQPVPTLSGGEAQRLKLAGHLAEAARSSTSRARSADASSGKLFLFDEPTTGLHFDDVAKLLRAFRELIAAGHSLIVIEHNLDVVDASDWVIDLGPEGGDAGGSVVYAGTVGGLVRCAESHTGAALAAYRAALDAPAALPARAASRSRETRTSTDIRIHNAREHNLKNVDVSIPRDRFTVVTGVSGSGKSTLAFDILFAEGQRRYLESLNAYARQFVQPGARPAVDAIFGIPPTVAIEQRTSRGGRKSTVATLTEIYHFLRLLYVKLGTQHCPDHDVPIAPQTEDSIVATLLTRHRDRRIVVLAPLVIARKGYYTDLAKWAARRGVTHLRVDGEMLPTAKWPRLGRFKEHTLELPVAELAASPANEQALRKALAEALAHGKGVVHVLRANGRGDQSGARRNGNGTSSPVEVFSTQRACPVCSRSFPAPRSAAVLVQLAARLVPRLLRHGRCAQGLRRGTDGRRGVVERVVRRRCPRVPDVRRQASQSRGARGAVPRSLHRGSHRAAGRRRAAFLRGARARRARRGDRARHRHRARIASVVPDRRRPRLSGARPLGADAVGRRGAAHPPRRAARLQSARRVLHPRRAHDRTACARQSRAPRHAQQAAGERQHARRGRAR
jgi:excinuclease ABC subunit A